MKCPNCSQEIIDNKEFCPNCGRRLKEPKRDIKPKTVIIIIAILLLFGTGLCLSIMYLGTEKELKPFKEDVGKVKEEDEKESEININTYYGSYTIIDVIPTNNTPEHIKESDSELLGWSVELNENQVKLGLYKIEWILINKPTINVIEDESINDLFDNNYKTTNIFVTGKEMVYGNNVDINFVVNNNKIYVYYYDTLFQLKKSDLEYRENTNFYKINLLKPNYTKEINDRIDALNTNFKNAIEISKENIIFINNEIIEDGNIVHILVEKIQGPMYAGAVTSTEIINYNKNTFKVYNLEDYLKYRGKTLEAIAAVYESSVQEQQQQSEDYIETPENLTKNSLYYANNNKIYIKYATGQFGYLYVEIPL